VELYTVVEYESREILNNEDIEVLKKYTQGQLSDGIGEGFEQQPVMHEGDKKIYVSPWYMGQKLKVEQIEIEGQKTKRPKVQMDSTNYWSEQYDDQIKKINDLMDKLKDLLDKDKKTKFFS
jgi:hypothetical protein